MPWKTNPIWSNENTEFVKELWIKRGLMAKEIALILQERTGQQVTPNMIISKVNRDKMVREMPRRKRIPDKPQIPVKVVTKPIEEPPAVIEPAIPDGYALHEMEKNQCRFAVSPHQTKNHRFCGRPTMQGEDWCRGHYNIVYRPLEIRRRR